jgi:hypothetical protein
VAVFVCDTVVFTHRVYAEHLVVKNIIKVVDIVEVMVEEEDAKLVKIAFRILFLNLEFAKSI